MNICTQIRKYPIGAAVVTDNSFLDVSLETLFPANSAFSLFGMYHWMSLELCMEELRSVKYLLLMQKNTTFIYYIKIYLTKCKLVIWGQCVSCFNPTSTVLWIAKSWTILVNSCFWWQQTKQLCYNKSFLFNKEKEGRHLNDNLWEEFFFFFFKQTSWLYLLGKFIPHQYSFHMLSRKWQLV